MLGLIYISDQCIFFHCFRKLPTAVTQKLLDTNTKHIAKILRNVFCVSAVNSSNVIRARPPRVAIPHADPKVNILPQLVRACPLDLPFLRVSRWKL